MSVVVIHSRHEKHCPDNKNRWHLRKVPSFLDNLVRHVFTILGNDYVAGLWGRLEVFPQHEHFNDVYHGFVRLKDDVLRTRLHESELTVCQSFLVHLLDQYILDCTSLLDHHAICSILPSIFQDRTEVLKLH